MVDLIVFCSLVNIVIVGLSYGICKFSFGNSVKDSSHAV